MKVCSDHFTPEDFISSANQKRKLKKGACPSVFSWTSQAQERSLPAKRSKLQEEQEILEAEITATACEVPRFFADFKSTTLLWLHAQRPHHTLHKHHEYNFRWKICTLLNQYPFYHHPGGCEVVLWWTSEEDEDFWSNLNLTPLWDTIFFLYCLPITDHVTPTRKRSIAGLRIHVGRAINKIKNFLIWKGEIPLCLFSFVNQMWSVCAFLCNTQDPLISE